MSRMFPKSVSSQTILSRPEREIESAKGRKREKERDLRPGGPGSMQTAGSRQHADSWEQAACRQLGTGSMQAALSGQHSSSLA
jgi:hypothetical protein